MVEQAIENRRVPSSNLGPGILIPLLSFREKPAGFGMAQLETAEYCSTMREHPLNSNRMFNNADSFAQAFDEAWQKHEQRDPHHGLNPAAKLDLMLEGLGDHPFLQNQPELARQVAAFRLRLLGLAGPSQ